MCSEIILFVRREPVLFEGSLCLDRGEMGQSIDGHPCLPLAVPQTLQRGGHSQLPDIHLRSQQAGSPHGNNGSSWWKDCSETRGRSVKGRSSCVIICIFIQELMERKGKCAFGQTGCFDLRAATAWKENDQELAMDPCEEMGSSWSANWKGFKCCLENLKFNFNWGRAKVNGLYFTKGN